MGVLRIYLHRRPVRLSEKAISVAVGNYLALQLPQAYLDEIAASDGGRPVLCVNGWRIGIWGRRVTERRKGFREAQQWLGNGGIEALCVLWYPDVLYTCADEEVLRRLGSDRFDGALLRTAGVGIVGSALFRMRLAGIARVLAAVVPSLKCPVFRGVGPGSE